MNPTICPKCNSHSTFCINDFLEYLKIRQCEYCGCQYEVEYEMQVKEIRIKE